MFSSRTARSAQKLHRTHTHTQCVCLLVFDTRFFGVNALEPETERFSWKSTIVLSNLNRVRDTNVKKPSEIRDVLEHCVFTVDASRVVNYVFINNLVVFCELSIHTARNWRTRRTGCTRVMFTKTGVCRSALTEVTRNSNKPNVYVAIAISTRFAKRVRDRKCAFPIDMDRRPESRSGSARPGQYEDCATTVGADLRTDVSQRPEKLSAFQYSCYCEHRCCFVLKCFVSIR